MSISDARRLKILAEENRKLKHLVADLSLDKQILQELLEKTFNTQSETESRRLCTIALWAEQTGSLYAS